jgi:RimJ/RimL family protein N-acetyltransferase
MTNAGDGRISCARFALIPFSLEFIDALLRGDNAAAERAIGVRLPEMEWRGADERFLRFRRDDLLSDPSSSAWLARAIVLPDSTMAGHVGFHGPPDADRMVEIGYAVFEPYRRQRFALDAIGDMMAWARERGVLRFRLSIAPDNEPSLALAAKLGFARSGEQIDQFDGLELTFEQDAT